MTFKRVSILFEQRDPGLLRKSKALEKEIDDMIAVYHKEKLDAMQGTFFVDNH